MDVALWEALPPAERAKIEVEKKAEEEKRTAEQVSSNWLFGRRLVRGP